MAIRNETRVAVEVHDPVAPTAAKTVKSAKRVPDLRGKKIGLYWNTKPGGDAGLEEIARLTEAKYEGVKFKKFYHRFPAPKHVLEKVAQSGVDGIISATAD
ncbi:MAG: hypothetical protein HYX92_16650 [Chloroflexi bacterium]|nr:hypothetical protein [Chloroflexota bacterium]